MNQITLEDLKACVEVITTKLKEEPDADEIFAKLGYKKVEKNYYIEYIKSDDIEERKITIDKQTSPFYRYMKSMYDDPCMCSFITEDEDQAIHKKIRELKMYEQFAKIF